MIFFYHWSDYTIMRKYKKRETQTIRFQSGHVGKLDEIRLANGRTYSIDLLANQQQNRQSWNLAWSRKSTTNGRALRYTAEEREWILANKLEAICKRYNITRSQAVNLVYSSRLKLRTKNDTTD